MYQTTGDSELLHWKKSGSSLSESFLNPLCHWAGLKPIKRRSPHYSTHLSYWKNDIVILNVTRLFMFTGI